MGCRLFAGKTRFVLPKLLWGALLLLLLAVAWSPVLSLMHALWAAPQPRTTQVPLLGILFVSVIGK